jgi:hypothetical protein
LRSLVSCHQSLPPLSLLLVAILVVSGTSPAGAQSFVPGPIFTFDGLGPNAILVPAEIDPKRPGKELLLFTGIPNAGWNVSAAFPVDRVSRPIPARHVPGKALDGATIWLCLEPPTLLHETPLGFGLLNVADLNGDGLDDLLWGSFWGGKLQVMPIFGTGRKHC